MKDTGGDSDEAAAGEGFDGALGSVEVLGVTEAEVDDGDGEEAEECGHGGREPDSQNGGRHDEINGHGGGESAHGSAGGALDEGEVEGAVREAENDDGEGEKGELGGERKGWKKRGGGEGESEQGDHGEGVAAVEGGKPGLHIRPGGTRHGVAWQKGRRRERGRTAGRA